VAGAAAPGPYRFPLRVRFGDVDHAGIVYYPRYFEYFHTAFEEMFMGAGAGGYRHVVDDRSVGFPAVKVECEFRAPLRFGDEVDVEVTCERVGRSSVTLRYRSIKDGAATAEARITCACVDMKVLRAIPIPDDLRAMFESLRP
jgi:4-hydroxybenzoyl-CoA thioesterase